MEKEEKQYISKVAVPIDEEQIIYEIKDAEARRLIEYMPEGGSANYLVYPRESGEDGWRRVASVLRGQTGVVNFTCGTNRVAEGRSVQGILMGFAGATNFINETGAYKSGYVANLIQISNTFSGEKFGERPERDTYIDKVRIVGNKGFLRNSLICFIDVHFHFGNTTQYAQFLLNKMGKSDNNSVVNIFEEMYAPMEQFTYENLGEEVTVDLEVYSEINLKPNFGIYASNLEHQIDQLAVENLLGTDSISFSRAQDSKIGSKSTTLGDACVASGIYSYAEGLRSISTGSASHAEGRDCQATANRAHAEGDTTIASGIYSHSEGWTTKAQASYSHAEGRDTTVEATADAAHVEGRACQAGDPTVASSGKYAHAEGYTTKAVGTSSHAEGTQTRSIGNNSHSEGYFTVATGASSHAEGANTTAAGTRAHAEGDNTQAIGGYSHAEGYYTIANRQYQHVQGKYNDETATPGSGAAQFVDVVGWGTDDNHKKNIYTLDSDGNGIFSGNVVAKIVENGVTQIGMISPTRISVTEDDGNEEYSATISKKGMRIWHGASDCNATYGYEGIVLNGDQNVGTGPVIDIKFNPSTGRILLDQQGLHFDGDEMDVHPGMISGLLDLEDNAPGSCAVNKNTLFKYISKTESFNGDTFINPQDESVIPIYVVPNTNYYATDIADDSHGEEDPIWDYYNGMHFYFLNPSDDSPLLANDYDSVSIQFKTGESVPSITFEGNIVLTGDVAKPNSIVEYSANYVHGTWNIICKNVEL